MPFIQLRQTNASSDDVFRLIFGEERDEIAMREHFFVMLDEKQTHTHTKKKKNKEKTEKHDKISTFSTTQSTLFYLNLGRSLDLT
jgi:hypothetical protein